MSNTPVRLLTRSFNNATNLPYIFLFALLLTLVPALSFSEDNQRTVTVTGMADGTSAQARDEAVNDALRQAVAQGMGTFVSSETLVENMTLVEDRIYSGSKGYIKNYEVVQEGAEGDTYKVKISAVVKLDKLAEDLESIGLLLRKKQNPRVIVIMRDGEKGESRETGRYIESQVEQGLMAKGFQIIDADQNRYKKEIEASLSRNDLSKAGKIAKDFGAEVLIIGNVKRDFVDNRMLYGRSIRFMSNEVRIKALETDTAKVLYSGFRTKPPSGENALFPLEESSTELIEEMTAGILEQWKKDVYQTSSYQIHVSNAAMSHINALKKELQKIRGVGGFQVRNFQSGTALLEVKYKGSLDEMVEKIDSIKVPKLDIVGFQSNTIELKIKEK